VIVKYTFKNWNYLLKVKFWDPIFEMSYRSSDIFIACDIMINLSNATNLYRTLKMIAIFEQVSIQFYRLSNGKTFVV